MIKFIAEIGSNHNGELDRALKLIEAAKEIGCDAVKFQHGERVFDPKSKKVNLALPQHWIKKLKRACEDEGLEFGCTPLDLQAVEDLRPHVDFFKIASYDLTWYQLVRSLSRTYHSIYVSTGMADRFEIQRVLTVYGDYAPVVLMHCVSQYPAQEGKLDRIDWLKERFAGVAIGYSDHTKNRNVLIEAAKKVDVIEFHLDLDGGGAEYKAGHCWCPNEVSSVISEINPDWKERAWRRDPEDGLRPMGWAR